MANAQSTIDLIFNGVDRASEVAKNLGNNLGNLSGSAQAISQPFADMAGRLAVVQVGMTALAGVIGGVAYNESAKFQGSLAALQKQMEDGEGTAEQYVNQLRELALRYGENGNVLTESAADFKAAGYDIDTSIQLVKSAMDLAIAGGIETSKAVDLMNRTLAGFQVPAADAVKEATHIGDTLNKVADITKSSFVELASGFADLSPIAKQSGLSIEETAAILSKVIDVFGSGSEAANGLKSGFLSLVDPSRESAAAMEAMGVHYRNADGTIKSVKDILAELGPAFERMDASQRLAAASIIFGKDQAAKMVQVLLNYSDAMEMAGRVSREAGGSIDKEVAIKLALAETAVRRTDEAFRQLLETLGNQFRDRLTGAITSVGDLAVAFRDVVQSGKLDTLFNALKGELGGIETLFKTIAKNLPDAFNGLDFSGLLSSLGDLKEQAKVAFEALFGPIDLSSVNGLRDALQRVVNAITALTRITAGEFDISSPFMQFLSGIAKNVVNADAGTQKFVGTLIGLGAWINKSASYFDGINTALLAFIAFGPKLAAIPAAIGAISAGFTAFAASSAGLAVGIAGAAAGVALFAAKAAQLTGLDKTLNDVLAPDWLAGKGASLGTVAADLAEGLGLLGPAAVNASTDIHRIPPELQAATAAARETRVAINAYLDAQEAAAKKTVDTTAETARMVAVWRQLGYEYDAATGKLSSISDSMKKFESDLPSGVKKTTDAFSESGKAAAELGGALGGLSTKYEKASNAAVRATGAFAGPGEAAKKQAEQVEEAISKSLEYKQKMEELASNERIKTIEAVVSLKTEGLKQDAERVKATFASIDATVKSTGDLLGSLFGNLTQADRWTQLKIESQIALENKRRDEALQLQKKMADAEIERIRAQADALNRGDSVIKIDGAGLEPELEAFMWKILKKIRISANEQFREYLLGLNPVT